MESRASIPVSPPHPNPLPSYWPSSTSPQNIPTPPTLPNSHPYTHIIIGSGISGTLTAHSLLNSHPPSAPPPSILLLDARAPCTGATGRNGGHTKAASYRTYLAHKKALGRDEALRIARLEYACILATHELAKQLDIECESALCNTVDVIYDKSVFDAGRAGIKDLIADVEDDEKEEGGMGWYVVHEPRADVLERFHVVGANENPEVHGRDKEDVQGVFEYMAGRIHAYRFTMGVLGKCVEKGLKVCANTRVDSVVRSSSSSSSFDGKPLWDVRTEHGTVMAEKVVFATNGYTPYLLGEMQGAIVPMRGHITAQRPGRGNRLETPLGTTYSFIYKDGYEYMIPRPLKDGGQHIVIGGGLGRLPADGASEYGTVDDASLNPQISSYLRGSLTGYFGAENWGEKTKEDESQRVVQEWTGIMGATADGRPYVGEVPGKQGLWISAGFNGHGMVLCLKSAEALVEMMNGRGKPEWFPESFMVSEERLAKANFTGRTDMKVPF